MKQLWVKEKMMDSHFMHLPPEEAQKTMDAVYQALPMGRMGMPDDMVGAAIYLACFRRIGLHRWQRDHHRRCCNHIIIQEASEENIN